MGNGHIAISSKDGIPKWQQSWVFRLWTMDIKDIAIGITKIDENIYQWPQDQLPAALSIRTSPAEIRTQKNALHPKLCISSYSALTP